MASFFSTEDFYIIPSIPPIPGGIPPGIPPAGDSSGISETIALLLLATIAVGISTGNLEVGAPWG